MLHTRSGNLFRFSAITTLLLAITLFVGGVPGYAQDAEPLQVVASNPQLLSINGDSGQATWRIENEPSLVMNGFNLTSGPVVSPVVINSINISILQAVPGQPVEAVFYDDSNGGDPSDAILVYRFSTTIDTTGNIQVPLPEALFFEGSVLWAGFYLPVGTNFAADTSGSSVLTYWGWTPGTTFDLVSPGNATVFGPSDGSAPVNINLGGVARITLNVDGTPGSGQPVGSGFVGDPSIGRQIAGGSVDTSALSAYSTCAGVLFDAQDIAVSGRDTFDLTCRADVPQDFPGGIRNLDEVDMGVASFYRQGTLFDIRAWGDYLKPGNNENVELKVPVTHCVRPDGAITNDAVIGIAWGAPKEWKILPSVRYGDLVCAEMTHFGLLSLFTPRQPESPTLSADLYFIKATVEHDDPNIGDVRCGEPAELRFAIRNQGFQPTPQSNIRIEDFGVRTNSLTQAFDIALRPLEPGETLDFVYRYNTSTLFVGEEHRIVLTADSNSTVSETDESDNQFAVTYLLRRGSRC